MPGHAEIVRAHSALLKPHLLLRYYFDSIAVNRMPCPGMEADSNDIVDLPTINAQQGITLALNRAAAPDRSFMPDQLEIHVSIMSLKTELKKRLAIMQHKQTLLEPPSQAHRKYRNGSQALCSRSMPVTRLQAANVGAAPRPIKYGTQGLFKPALRQLRSDCSYHEFCHVASAGTCSKLCII